MNCEEVAKHLTEYLDKTLDMAMTTRVATHVIACALCRTETNELADCIQQVTTLPAMDPPLGFAQRVMAHVRDSEAKPSLWQRLIVPLTSGISVRATAIAVVAIFAVVLYQKEPALKPNSDVNLALTDSKAQIKENELAAAGRASEMDQKKPVQVKAPADLATFSVAEKSSRASSSSPAESPLLQPAAPAPLRAEIESAVEEKNDAPRRPPLRVQEVTTARDSNLTLSDPRGFAQLPASLGAVRQSASRPAPLALERSIPIGDRVADIEFTVRRRSPQRRDVIESLSSAEVESSPTTTPRPANTPTTGKARIESIGEIRFYNVAPEHFEIFKKELAVEAIVESEPKVPAKEIEAAKQADRQLLVKVTILPAENPSR